MLCSGIPTPSLSARQTCSSLRCPRPRKAAAPQSGGGRAVQCECHRILPSRPTRWPEPAAGTGPAGRRARPYLCLALMCICRPFRLEARCPHSSHTNSFSPRCLKASWSCSSVRVRKHLSQVGHCRAGGTGQREQGQGEGGAGPRWECHTAEAAQPTLWTSDSPSIRAGPPRPRTAGHSQHGAWGHHAA